MDGESAPGRVLGLDLGNVRVGVAISDSHRRIALPRAILTPSSVDELVFALERYIVDEQVTLVVIGLPLSLNGTRGRAASAALSVMTELRDRLSVPVLAEDERLTTVEATRRLTERESGAGTRRKSRPRRRVDDAAAALVLQAFLDRSVPL